MHNKQLQTRVLTAVVLGPLFLAAIFLLQPFWFSLIMAVLLLYGGWEYSQLCKFRSASLRHVFVMLHGLLMAAGLVLLWNAGVGGFDIRFNYIIVAVALTALWAFSRFYTAGQVQTGESSTMVSAIQGLVLITGSWLALSWLRFQPQGNWLILQLLLIIWVADIAAYFTGRAFGKSKLAPKISPGKTWAGVAGAVVFAPLAALACGWYSPAPDMGTITTVLLALVTVWASIGGDLFISLLKRAAGVKDSGKLLPGHGGVLDRFDSLITGSVFFVLGLLFLIEHSG